MSLKLRLVLLAPFDAAKAKITVARDHPNLGHTRAIHQRGVAKVEKRLLSKILRGRPWHQRRVRRAAVLALGGSREAL